MKTSPQSTFDKAIDAALDTRPVPAIPADFAGRVRRSLPPVQAARHTFHAGRSAAIASMAVLLIACFALAPHTAPTFQSFTFDIELALIAQLIGITWWLATPSSHSR